MDQGVTNYLINNIIYYKNYLICMYSVLYKKINMYDMKI